MLTKSTSTGFILSFIPSKTKWCQFGLNLRNFLKFPISYSRMVIAILGSSMQLSPPNLIFLFGFWTNIDYCSCYMLFLKDWAWFHFSFFSSVFSKLFMSSLFNLSSFIYYWSWFWEAIYLLWLFVFLRLLLNFEDWADGAWLPDIYWFEFKIDGLMYFILYNGMFYLFCWIYWDDCDWKLSSFNFTAFLLGGIFENIYCCLPPFVECIYFFFWEGDYDRIYDGEKVLSIWFIFFC